MTPSRGTQAVDAAKALLLAGRPAEAADLLQRLPLADRESYPTLLLLARALWAQGDLAGALGAITTILRLHPHELRHAALMRDIALALHARGFWQEAMPLLEAVAALEPWDPLPQRILSRIRRPDHLAPVVDDPHLGRLARTAAREGETYIYTIDIVGTCNLRCPTCPVGNTDRGERPLGFMTRPMFEAIIAKIRAESPVASPRIDLFNWGEPLLHPELPAFLGILRRAGLRSHLSSNLNIKQGLEAVIAAEPDDLKISLSGFTPETYAKTHARGDIALVKRNMVAIRRYLDAYKARTHVWVGHHLYRSNQHEAEAVRRFCAELGFGYHPFAAYYMPLERVMDVMQGRPNPRDGGILADLLHPPAPGVPAPRRSPGFDCELRFNQTVINHDGSVALCCTVYDRPNMLGVGFLDESREALERRKYAHSFCSTCFAQDLHYAPVPLAAGGAG